jgi:hypothetical protein
MVQKCQQFANCAAGKAVWPIAGGTGKKQGYCFFTLSLPRTMRVLALVAILLNLCAASPGGEIAEKQRIYLDAVALQDGRAPVAGLPAFLRLCTDTYGIHTQ